jgi:hypothetical protein
MTEKEWQTCNDTWLMLPALRGQLSERKGRLFALASGCRVQQILALPHVQALVDAVETYLEHGRSFEDVRPLRQHVSRFCGQLLLWVSDGCPDTAAPDYEEIPQLVNKRDAEEMESALRLVRWAATEAITIRLLQDYPAGPVASAALLRCIVGNPFRPTSLDPNWRTTTVLALAQGIYDDRAFDRLPILADALQDAGCDNEEMLAHCRGPGPHARGCWVVDLVLGKA